MSDACEQLDRRDATTTVVFQGHGGGLPIVGLARPVAVVAVERAPERHYGQEIDFIDSLRPTDVPVIAAFTDRAACWGELFSAAAKARGAVGAIIDGHIRDVKGINELGWPVLARGVRPSDSLGRVSMTAPGEPVTIGGLLIRRGDLVVADGDGVTTVPAEIAVQAAKLAIEKAQKETAARAMLREGSFLREAWERHQVL